MKSRFMQIVARKLQKPLKTLENVIQCLKIKRQCRTQQFMQITARGFMACIKIAYDNHVCK